MSLLATSTLVRCLLLMTVTVCAGAVLGCTVASSDAGEDPTSTVASPIIDADNVSDTFVDGVPILINSALVASSGGTGGGCSGLLLTNNWVLTAGHCVAKAWPTDRTPVAPTAVSLTLGAGSLAPEQRFAAEIHVHPTLDAAVLRVSTPLPMNGRAWGYSRQLSAAHQNLSGTSVRCLGYGSRSVGAPMGGLGSAAFTVQSILTNEFIIPQNQYGQAIWFGDSGGPCLENDGSLIGIAESLTGVAPPNGLSGAFETAVWGLHPWIDTFLNSTYRNPHQRSIVWRSRPPLGLAGGAPDLWRMDGGTLGSETLLPSVGSEWQIQGTGDFDGDGEGDILWRSNTGQLAIWFMSFGIVRAQGSPGLNVGPEWLVEGIGDFNGDLHADILWRRNDGQVGIWYMSGASRIGDVYPGGPVDSTWQIQGVGDFDGNHKSDILWRRNDGPLAIWFDGGVTNISYPTNCPGADWQVKGVADFNGNGLSDILWRYADGQVDIWYDANPAVVGTLGGVALVWTILGTGDFDGNGRSDILWRQSDGALAIWPDANSAAVAYPGYTNTAFTATLGNSY